MSTIDNTVNKAISDMVAPMVQRAISEQMIVVAEGLQNGQSLRDLFPAIDAVIDKKADARNRAIRTFMQNILIDIAITLLTVFGTAIATLDITSKEAWTALGLLLAKTAISAPVAYVMRMRVKPATVPATTTGGGE